MDLVGMSRVDDLRPVRRWDPLSERQLQLLRRIAEGDDLSGPDGLNQRTSGRALANRGLAQVTRADGSWRAHISDAGQFYLQHGYHPDRPGRDEPLAVAQNDGPPQGPDHAAGKPRTARKAPGPLTSAEDLIKQLQAAGGTVRLEELGADARAEYRRAIHAAKEHDLVPEGFRLLHTGRDKGDLIIRLEDVNNPDETDWNRIRLNTRRDSTDPADVFAALDKDPVGLAVAAESVPRAIALVRALALEARRRGHRVGVKTRTKHPRLYVRVGKATKALTLHEEYDQVPHQLTAEERREQRRMPWRTFPEFDSVRSGRLRIEVARRAWNEADSWSDTKRSQLEKRLPKIIRDIEAGFAADEEARIQAEKAAAERQARWEREEQEKRDRWRQAMAKARVEATQKLRKDTFVEAQQRWIAAREIREFCHDLEHALHDEPEEARRSTLRQWIDWGRGEADAIDPIGEERALANTPFEIDPLPNDLRPFLGNWSPNGPRQEYRSESDNEQLAHARLEAKTWHPGLRGKPAWWR